MFNGHLVHPDIWVLWFSFIVSLLVVAKWLGGLAIEIYSLIDYFSSQPKKAKVLRMPSTQSFYRPDRKGRYSWFGGENE